MSINHIIKAIVKSNPQHPLNTILGCWNPQGRSTAPSPEFLESKEYLHYIDVELPPIIANLDVGKTKSISSSLGKKRKVGSVEAEVSSTRQSTIKVGFNNIFSEAKWFGDFLTLEMPKYEFFFLSYNIRN